MSRDAEKKNAKYIQRPKMEPRNSNPNTKDVKKKKRMRVSCCISSHSHVLPSQSIQVRATQPAPSCKSKRQARPAVRVSSCIRVQQVQHTRTTPSCILVQVQESSLAHVSTLAQSGCLSSLASHQSSLRPCLQPSTSK